MILKEIKQAIDEGKRVHWASHSYDIIKTYDYLILCTINDHVIGLTHRDEVTMNGAEQEFFICENKEHHDSNIIPSECQAYYDLSLGEQVDAYKDQRKKTKQIK